MARAFMLNCLFSESYSDDKAHSMDEDEEDYEASPPFEASQSVLGGSQSFGGDVDNENEKLFDSVAAGQPNPQVDKRKKELLGLRLGFPPPADNNKNKMPPPTNCNVRKAIKKSSSSASSDPEPCSSRGGSGCSSSDSDARMSAITEGIKSLNLEVSHLRTELSNVVTRNDCGPQCSCKDQANDWDELVQSMSSRDGHNTALLLCKLIFNLIKHLNSLGIFDSLFSHICMLIVQFVQLINSYLYPAYISDRRNSSIDLTSILSSRRRSS